MCERESDSCLEASLGKLQILKRNSRIVESVFWWHTGIEASLGVTHTVHRGTKMILVLGGLIRCDSLRSGEVPDLDDRWQQSDNAKYYRLDQPNLNQKISSSASLSVSLSHLRQAFKKIIFLSSVQFTMA